MRREPDNDAGVLLGLDARGEPIRLTPNLRASTHMHVVGGSGKGKSKFLESMIRQDIKSGRGVCVIDWHGELYNNIVKWCADENIGVFGDPRQVIVLNVAHPEHVLPFNPFAKKTGDTSSRAADLVSLVLRAWNMTNALEMPTFRRTCTALFRFMLEEQETLPNAAHLLEYSNRKTLLDYAVRATAENMRERDFWQRLASVKNATEWDGQMLSTTNKLAPLLEYSAPRRFMGLDTVGLDVEKVMDDGGIVLVNLVHSEHLPIDAARVFAGFLLYEFFMAARKRGDKKSRMSVDPDLFVLYLDEFQEYISEDMAAMLDQVRKGGLHMVLAHQHMAHFLEYPKLKESILGNARLRAVFGGLSTQSACALAEEMCLAELNERQIKKALYHTIHLYKEDTRTIYSESSSEAESESESATETESSGHGESTAEGTSSSSSSGTSATSIGAFVYPATDGFLGWLDREALSETDSAGETSSTFDSSSSSSVTTSSEFSSRGSSRGRSRGTSRGMSRGTSVVPVWVPTPVQELASEQDWTLEEKRLKLAQMLKYQTERHCFINLDAPGGTQPLCVPFVNSQYISPALLEEYEKMLCELQGSLPAVEVDRLLEEGEREFAERVKLHRPKTAALPVAMVHSDPDDDVPLE